MSARGVARERQVRRMLEGQDWWTCRAAGSIGEADVVALRAGNTPRLVQVKSDRLSPYTHFGPRHRAQLRLAAEVAGATAWIAWWPPRGQLRWIGEEEWPR